MASFIIWQQHQFDLIRNMEEKKCCVSAPSKKFVIFDISKNRVSWVSLHGRGGGVTDGIEKRNKKLKVLFERKELHFQIPL